MMVDMYEGGTIKDFKGDSMDKVKGTEGLKENLDRSFKIEDTGRHLIDKVGGCNHPKNALKHYVQGSSHF